MTDYNILNTLFRTAIAFTLIGALFTVPLLAAAAECSFLSTEFHAAAREAADTFDDELRLELAKNIRLPTLPQVSPAVATAVAANGPMDDIVGPMGDVVQEDRPMLSDAGNESRGNDT